MPAFEKETYRCRTVVKRCANWLKQWSGVAIRDEKRAASYRAMVVIAALMIWLGGRCVKQALGVRNAHRTRRTQRTATGAANPGRSGQSCGRAGGRPAAGAATVGSPLHPRGQGDHTAEQLAQAEPRQVALQQNCPPRPPVEEVGGQRGVEQERFQPGEGARPGGEWLDSCDNDVEDGSGVVDTISIRCVPNTYTVELIQYQPGFLPQVKRQTAVVTSSSWTAVMFSFHLS
jgi:hypothetical protein